ncbi:MAG TPA: class I SAM-dependent methyltransferase [Acidimicrobiales bacterium]|nr:class I SAM-dependent methyltransferase [Acidimicrobiales bacterium]
MGGAKTVDKVVEAVRRAALRYRLDRVIKPVETVPLYLAYLGRFVAWSSRHSAPDLGRGPHARYLLYQQVLKSQALDQRPIGYLEFGVFQGDSIRWWLRNNVDPDSTFVGFDTFTGLAEQWGARSVGTFSTQGQVPQIDDPRCSFEVGFFQETLPGFLQRSGPSGERAVYHLDADLYSSTLFVLTQLVPFLKAGDVLIFDQFSSVLHEFRALEDWVAAYPCRYEVLGSSNDCTQVALKLTEPFEPGERLSGAEAPETSETTPSRRRRSVEGDSGAQKLPGVDRT